MILFHPNAEATARKYIGSNLSLEVLGWGMDGAVYHIPSATTAIKVYSRTDLFNAELAVYKRFRKHKVTHIQGFAIPQMSAFNSSLCVIEMSIVAPRCLLDFAKTTVDRRPDFSPEVMDWYWRKVEALFGDNFPTVLSVNSELITKYGIYYTDFKPDNMQFDQK